MDNERKIEIEVPEGASQEQIDAEADKAIDKMVDEDVDDLLKGL